MATILNFRIFCKIAKHKNAYISKTVLDRSILTKFLTHRVSLQSSHANFQKKICLPKNGGHFEFSNFCAKIAKRKNANISNCSGSGLVKNFCLPKNGGHFEFSKFLQNTKMLISRKPCYMERTEQNF